MGLRQCDKCSETVDEAKAFCPGCGHALVAEQSRSEASNFDKMDSTVQLGQTMYNQMLSDMGLNISKAPDPVEKRVEIIAPIVSDPKPTVTKPPVVVAGSSTKKWIIIAVSVVVLFFLLTLALAAVVFIYWYQFR